MTTRTDPMKVMWYPVQDTLVGGWAVSTANKPTHEIMPGDQAWVVGDMLTEEIARHVAWSHNLTIDNPARRGERYSIKHTSDLFTCGCGHWTITYTDRPGFRAGFTGHEGLAWLVERILNDHQFTDKHISKFAWELMQQHSPVTEEKENEQN